VTEDELALLDFEDQWWRHPGAKETAIRERFGITPTRYYQRLNALMRKPEAHAARPLLVGRLQRQTAARADRVARRRQPGPLTA
jgi:hypothetical protein